MNFNYKQKYLLIIILFVLLFIIVCKCLMIEKFDAEIENIIQTMQSSGDGLTLNIERINQQQQGKIMPSGVQKMSQLSKDLTYNLNNRFNITTQS